MKNASGSTTLDTTILTYRYTCTYKSNLQAARFRVSILVYTLHYGSSIQALAYRSRMQKWNNRTQDMVPRKVCPRFHKAPWTLLLLGRAQFYETSVWSFSHPIGVFLAFSATRWNSLRSGNRARLERSHGRQTPAAWWHHRTYASSGEPIEPA